MNKVIALINVRPSRNPSLTTAQLNYGWSLSWLPLLQVKLCAVDAVYNKEGSVVNALNAFLGKHPFGPYNHLSDAAHEV